MGKKKTADVGFQVRQGDVLVMSAATAPKYFAQNDLVEVKEAGTGAEAILAYGEVTGHKHALRSDFGGVSLLEEVESPTNDQMNRMVAFLETQFDATLRHEEHGAIQVPPEKFIVIRQREWDRNQIRPVQD